jgi:hypothetical protein
MATATHEREQQVSVDLDTKRLQGWMNGAEDGATKVRQLRALCAVTRCLASDKSDVIDPDDFANLLDLIDGQLSDIEQEMTDAVEFMSMLKADDAPNGRSTRPTLKVIPSRKSKEG